MLVAVDLSEVRHDFVQRPQRAPFDLHLVGDEVEGEIGRNQTAAHEERHLHHVGPRHRGQTAVDRVDARHDEEHEDDREQRHVDLHAEEHAGRGGDAQNLLDGQRAQPGDRREVDEDVEEEPEDREREAHAPVVALAQELGDGEDAALDHHGEQEFADDDERRGGHEFVGGHGDARGVGRAGHADELFGRNVGGDERGAHGPPRQRVAGQKIVARGFLPAVFVAREEKSQTDQQNDVEHEDRIVDHREAVALECFDEIHV